jgi:hypothetical protein
LEEVTKNIFVESSYYLRYLMWHFNLFSMVLTVKVSRSGYKLVKESVSIDLTEKIDNVTTSDNKKVQRRLYRVFFFLISYLAGYDPIIK